MEALMMCSVAFRERQIPCDEKLLLRSTHEHHPYTRWVCSGDVALVWTLRLGKALCEEKRRRYPDNLPHQYESHFDGLIDAVATVAETLPYQLTNEQMPLVAMSAKSVPDAEVRKLIADTDDRARSFRLYYWHTKRHNSQIWRFGGAAETRARKRHGDRVVVIPDVWNEFQ